MYRKRQGKNFAERHRPVLLLDPEFPEPSVFA
jgi:hypothetical protein